MAPILEAEQALEDLFSAPDPREAVRVLFGTFELNPAFLRSVILESSTSPAIAQRGAKNVRRTRTRFIGASVGPRAPKPRKDAAQVAFGLVFSTLVVTTAYGPEFTGLPGRTKTLAELSSIVDHILR